jgi:hypothetical protein
MVRPQDCRGECQCQGNGESERESEDPADWMGEAVFGDAGDGCAGQGFGGVECQGGEE